MDITGRAPAASYGLDSRLEPANLYITLPGPGSGKLDPLIFVIGEIQAHAHGCGKLIFFPAFIFKTHTSGNCVFILKNRIQQGHFGLQQFIPQKDFQRIRLVLRFRIGCRKSFQPRFSLIDLMGNILEIRNPAAIFLLDFNRRHPKIRSSIRRVFLFQMLQCKRVFILIHIRGHRAVFIFCKIIIILFLWNPLSKIKLPHLPITHHFHQITDLIIIQMKFLCLFIIDNSHVASPYFYSVPVFPIRRPFIFSVTSRIFSPFRV